MRCPAPLWSPRSAGGTGLQHAVALYEAWPVPTPVRGEGGRGGEEEGHSLMSVRKEGDTREVVVDLDDWADLADRKIKEAQAAGHFDNLPGFGKPLQLYENPLEGEWALAHRILRNANISPPWIELQQQVQRRSDALRAQTGAGRTAVARPAPTAADTALLGTCARHQATPRGQRRGADTLPARGGGIGPPADLLQRGASAASLPATKAAPHTKACRRDLRQGLPAARRFAVTPARLGSYAPYSLSDHRSWMVHLRHKRRHRWAGAL